MPPAGEAKEEHIVTYEELAASKLYSQTLPAWMPMFTPKWTILTFFIAGPIFAGIGVVLKETSDGVAATKLFRYDNHAECAPKLANSPCKLGPPLGPDDPHYVPQDPLCWPRYNKTAHADYDNECTIHIEIEQDMKAPIYFYYQIDNFYQNQRVYVKSQAPFQLKGGPEGDKWADKREYQDALAKSCSSSGYDRCRTGAVPALPRDGDGSSNAGLFLCNPCGLIASSFFTDTFEVERVATGALLAGQDWTQGGIAWESDVRDKYRATDPSNLYNKRLEDQNKLVTDPDFIVWMRTAGLPTFRKLYRVINTDLPKGTKLAVKIRNNYDVSKLPLSAKSFVLSEVSWMGGQNPFFGVAYILFGALLFVLAIVFLVLEMTCHRRSPAASERP